MRENLQLYGELGDFSSYGGTAYCDLVGTNGFYAQQCEMAAMSDFAGRHLLILGQTVHYDRNFFAGSTALVAPVHLGFQEQPIIIAHWPITLALCHVRPALRGPHRRKRRKLAFKILRRAMQ